MLPTLQPDELLALSQWGYAARDYSPLGDQPWLLIDAGAADIPAPAMPRLAQWLRQQPCPTLAISKTANALSSLCDVQITRIDDAQPLIAAIQRSPIAATVLVQLLRSTEHLPLESALFAESLAYSTLQSGPEFGRWLAANRATTPARPGDDGPAVVMTRSGRDLHLELNRASNRNAMNIEMRDALIEALQLVLADDSVQQVTLRGRGKCFSTGGDLTEFGSLPDPAIAHIVRGLALPGRLLAACAGRVSVHLHGACIGSGIEFPAFAHRITASCEAWFQLPELKFGLIPGAGGTASIARRMGRQRTAWLALSGERIAADKALEWGLIDQITV